MTIFFCVNQTQEREKVGNSGYYEESLIQIKQTIFIKGVNKPRELELLLVSFVLVNKYSA